MEKKKDLFPLTQRIAYQMIDNHRARENGLPEYNLGYFCPSRPGYLSPEKYWCVGEIIKLSNACGSHPQFRFYKVDYPLRISYAGEVYDKDKIGEQGSPSTLAAAHPIILHVVMKHEMSKIE